MKRRTKVQSQAIEQALSKLQDRRGCLTPNAVVEAAKDKKSPLHGCFEWDDSKAAREHRLEQARILLRGVKLNIVTEEKVIQTVAYVRDPEAERLEQGYRTTASLRQDPASAKQALEYELSRAEAYIVRAEELAEAFGMKGAVAVLRSRLQGLRRKIMRKSA